MQSRDTVPNNALMRLHTARTQGWTEQLPHSGVVGGVLGCEDIPTRNSPVEWGLEEDVAFADGGVDVAHGFDGVGSCLAGGKAGDFSFQCQRM